MLIDYKEVLLILIFMCVSILRSNTILMRYAQIGRWLNYLFSPRRSWQSQSLSNCHYMKLADRSDRIPPVLHEWFIEMFPETEAWFAARLRYTRSTAVMSMVGYVLGYVHPFTSIDMYKANCRIPQTW